MNKPIPPLESEFKDDNAVRKTFPLFLNHLRRSANEFADQIDSHNWELISKTAHRTRGSAGSYGFPDLVDLICRLEGEAMQERRQRVLAEHLSHFRTLVDRIELGFSGSEKTTLN